MFSVSHSGFYKVNEFIAEEAQRHGVSSACDCLVCRSRRGSRGAGYEAAGLQVRDEDGRAGATR